MKKQQLIYNIFIKKFSHERKNVLLLNKWVFFIICCVVFVKKVEKVITNYQFSKYLLFSL